MQGTLYDAMLLGKSKSSLPSSQYGFLFTWFTLEVLMRFIPSLLICCTSKSDKILMHRTQLMNSLQGERVSRVQTIRCLNAKLLAR